ncbi:NAD(P)-dependent short-chain alcohol dehydrogenase [Emydomyces testavorans]|uniref:NAD(P)-dependent short-chain alcohol dehydrogenase n=1 Tax=Emydomyces testavorans TaxID=2070801 RepID=A0AAF0IGQ1_9EURO|nr:NAD(P)-dependent short-chain alcohol dehydrogenase [Emydomyces testavorans]
MFKASVFPPIFHSLFRRITITPAASRFISFTPTLCNSTTSPPSDNNEDTLKSASTTASTSESPSAHEGRYARTDESVRVEYPPDHEIPPTAVVQGRGGRHFKRTLASFSLEGRVSVITGGARGLGLVMGQALVASGSDLAIVDLNVQEAQEQAKNMRHQFQAENPGLDEKSFPKITAHRADVGNPESVDNGITEILKQHGRIDHLVTSAGFTENFDAVSYPHDRMQKLWSVNVDGSYLFAVAVAKHLMSRKSPGSIVFIGSMSGAIVNVPQPQAPYNAAKAAVRHLAASLAVEWAKVGIRVNCISPGYMLTALTRKILDDNPDLKQKWTSLIPQGKMGTPEDLMGAVTFLLSDASKYVTGADLRVDGGYTLT